MQGPEPFLTALDLEIAGPVLGDPAQIDVGHRVRVNDAFYYLSSDPALAAFADEPHLYTGRLSDMVTGERFQPKRGSPRRNVDAHIYLFASESSAAAFDASRARGSS